MAKYILGAIFLISVLAISPFVVHQWQHTPENTFYTFAHNYVPDYYQYISWMKDGADGKLLVTSRFSPDTFSRKPVYLFYSFTGLLLGKIGFRNLFLSYTLLRLVLGLVNLFLIYLFISQVLKKPLERVLALFLALFLPPFYHFKPLSLILPTVTGVDPLQRIFFIPHDLFTTSCFLLGIICLNHYFKFSIILFFLASLANPAMLIFFYLFLGVAALLYRKNLFILALVFAVGLPLIFYYQFLFRTTLPFSWFYQQQKVTTFNLSWLQFASTAGPSGILALFSLPAFFRRKDFLAQLVLAWAILPFAIFPFLGKIIPLSVERIFETSYFIPLAILSAVTLTKIAKPKIFLVILVNLILFSLPYSYLSLKTQIKLFAAPFYNVYVPIKTVEAFAWLEQNTPDEMTVAASFFTSNMIPAFTHNKVLFGHDFVTYKANERRELNNALFSDQTTPDVVEKILRENQINYVLLTPDNRKLEQTNLGQVKSLKLVFDNEENQIFAY